MKNIDDLVRKDGWISSGIKTFKGQREAYNKLLKKIEDLSKEKQYYENLLLEGNSSEEAINFRLALNSYNSLKKLNELSEQMSEQLFKQCPKLKTYLELCFNIRNTKSQKNDILRDNIRFDNFIDDERYNELCYSKHFLVNIKNNLVCMCCGATTEDFEISKEDVEFLELCAEAQGIYLKEVTEREIPLLQLLIAERLERLNSRIPVDELPEDSIMCHSDWVEEYYLEDEAIILDMRRTVAFAKMLDNGVYETDDYRVGNPKYLKPEETERFLREINAQILILESSSSKFKDLQLEICRTYLYEVLILSGKRIPSLYDDATNDDERIALVKAYANLSNQNYRVESGYFNHRNKYDDAIFYKCLTAHPEINKKILEMKLRR